MLGFNTSESKATARSKDNERLVLNTAGSEFINIVRQETGIDSASPTEEGCRAVLSSLALVLMFKFLVTFDCGA